MRASADQGHIALQCDGAPNEDVSQIRFRQRAQTDQRVGAKRWALGVDDG